MKVAILLDNNLSKAQVHPFEEITKRAEDIQVNVYIGQKNRHNTDSIKLGKVFLNHRSEVFNALLSPLSALRHLKDNDFPRMDYYYFSLKRLLRGVDVAYTQEVSRSLFTLAGLKRQCGYKILLRWWEVLPYKRLFSEKDTSVAKKALDAVDMFLPATQMARDALLIEGVPEENILHIYPGIDTERFAPASSSQEMRAKWGIPSQKTVVLFVGRLVGHKGIFSLLWTAKLLERKSLLENFVFLIVGDSGQRLRLEKMAEDMGIRGSFIFRGTVPYDIMPEMYQMSDMFVLPSLMKEKIQEMFGFVLAEAMACGKPVIGTAVGAIPEVIGDAGIIVTPGDYKALAGAFETVASDQQLRVELGGRGRKRAEELFSSQRNSQELLAIVRKLR